ncbi:MAG: hypothetical protein AAFN07_15180, partial [Pseudomonadota bacterium]
MKPAPNDLYHLIMATSLSGTRSRPALIVAAVVLIMGAATDIRGDTATTTAAVDEYRVDYEVVPLDGSEYSVTMRV